MTTSTSPLTARLKTTSSRRAVVTKPQTTTQVSSASLSEVTGDVVPRKRRKVTKPESTMTKKKPTLQTTTNKPTSTGAEKKRRDHPAYYGAEEMTLQLTDGTIVAAQSRSRLVQKILVSKKYRSMNVAKNFGLVLIETVNSIVAFKESHDSVWAGHLRAPHTYVTMQPEIQVASAAALVREPCIGGPTYAWKYNAGFEGVKSVAAVSLQGGDVGDRWTLDVAGPLPRAEGGERYVIAAVDSDDCGTACGQVLNEDAVLKFGVFRELLTDGAPELTDNVIELLVTMLQAEQTNPVPYRPQMNLEILRFDVHAGGRARRLGVLGAFAVYAYNSGRHSTVALSPNELMMGRKLRAPNDLLRSTSVTEAGELKQYHDKLLNVLNVHENGNNVDKLDTTIDKYEQSVHSRLETECGRFDLHKGRKRRSLCMRGWDQCVLLGPLVMITSLLEAKTETDCQETTYNSPTDELAVAATDIEAQLEYEGKVDEQDHDTTAGEIVGATTAAVHVTTAAAGKKRRRAATTNEASWRDTSQQLYEDGGDATKLATTYLKSSYDLPDENEDENDGVDEGEARWLSLAEYNEYFNNGRVVEDPVYGEGV
ncbi:LOW QUALITY PROTEIN: hypothetical protein PHMEG_00024395 [Phytophthora megakarya]|uniref:Uncharacterized protein n=1 Tax=Phytophthora megakarya TaxID=4795 RepID=A0A225VH39_9STRA|nr:LOW QUALITY PROTEIN: hypothetical protein PHMEG_00024395 [Phytophthora megakarya]